jgi:hypothetical protein
VTAVVITDGYRGDFATWRVALERRVAIGTLQAVAEIAGAPAKAFEVLQRRAGFERRPSGEAPQERVCELMGWTLRLVDARPP